MKVVYRPVITYVLNGAKSKDCPSIWYYGEKPADERVVLTMEQLKENSSFYSEKRLFSKKYHVRLPYTMTWVNEEDVKNAEKIIEYREPCFNYTMEDLMKHLSADDFVAWCKDREIKF